MTTLSAPIVLAPETRHQLRGLPPAVRKGLDLVTHLRYGRLDVTLPDGRTFRVRGREPARRGIW